MKPFARINGECCQCGSVASTNTNEVWPQRTQRTQREENDDEEIDGGDGVHSDGKSDRKLQATMRMPGREKRSLFWKCKNARGLSYWSSWHGLPGMG